MYQLSPKLSHLKELVVPRIRSALDCQPFTEEGYVCAVKYLRDKYGHPNEVAGHYIIALLELPPITERDVCKIHKFFEQLLLNVESLLRVNHMRGDYRHNKTCILCNYRKHFVFTHHILLFSLSLFSLLFIIHTLCYV